jgi:hypothetical protein
MMTTEKSPYDDPTYCKWCALLKDGWVNTDDKFIHPARYEAARAGWQNEPFWHHKVQLWGIGSMVAKACPNPARVTS